MKPHRHRDERRALVFASGEFDVSHMRNIDIRAADEIVCVDGGLVHCLAAGLRPTLLLGDMDSVSPELVSSIVDSGVEAIRYSAEKDASDLELALTVLADRGVNELILLGISGGRTDHMLFNWLLVVRRNWPFKLQLIDAHTHAILVNTDYPLEFPVVNSDTISLLPLLGPVCGVTTEGLRYQLQNAVLQTGSTRGLSNEAISTVCQVRVTSGTLLVMLSKCSV